MKKIEIFVSSRIDQLDSIFPENELYIQSFCGAELSNQSKIIRGDNSSSDNISHKKDSYCEFTVQYDAWKTSNADYIGLCHYRRFLIFDKTHKYKLNPWGQHEYFWLRNKWMNRIGILDKEKMTEEIVKNDFIINTSCDVRKITTPHGYQETVEEMWLAHDGVIFEKKYYYLMLAILKEKYPDIFVVAKEYLNGTHYRGFNCYIMKKDIFNEMNKFEFTILFEVEKCLNNIKYGNQMDRTLGYLGEILYGIYIDYLIRQNVYTYVELPLAMFWNTQRLTIKNMRDLNYKAIILNRIRALYNMFFPYGSKARARARCILYKLRK